MQYFILYISLIFVCIRTTSGEQSNSTTTFSTYKLPSNGTMLNFRILPYVGNGHVATVVYSDFVYMSGLFNGENSTLRFCFSLHCFFSKIQRYKPSSTHSKYNQLAI